MKNVSFKNYRIIKKLGQGGMATVYLAEHNLLGNKVAIKILNKEFLYNPNIKNRFISEARKMVHLDHPNIVRVTDLIDKEGQVAFVMEYLEGKTLKDILQQKKLNDDEIESFLNQMISALEYIHEEGLIHRDIKPSNFIFDKRGNLKLTDFGISKDTSVENNEYTQTATHINMGTPMYMSPEQIRSLKVVTKLTDIYSLGVVLWEMVTGKKPYNTQTLSSFELQTKIVNESLALTNTKWDGVIQKATQKAEEDRLYDLKYFLYPEQIDADQMVDLSDDKTIIYTEGEKKSPQISSKGVSKRGIKYKRSLIYFIVGSLVIFIASIILYETNKLDKLGINYVKPLSKKELEKLDTLINIKFNNYVTRLRVKEDYRIERYSKWTKRKSFTLELKIDGNKTRSFVDNFDKITGEHKRNIYYSFEDYVKEINSFLISSEVKEFFDFQPVTRKSFYYVNKISGDYINTYSPPTISPNKNNFISYKVDEGEVLFAIYSIMDNRYIKNTVIGSIDQVNIEISDVKWINDNRILIEYSKANISDENTIVFEYDNGEWIKAN